METLAHRAARALAIVALLLGARVALAQVRAKTDPDWPCQQIKVPTFSLGSVWAGPEIDVKSETWRGAAEVVALVGKMARRRVPIDEAEAAIADFAGKGGAEAKPKLLLALAGAFQELTSQRAQILDGLERFGKRQRDMADRIRAENEALQSAPADAANAQNQQSANAQEKLQWDLRVFEDRHRSISYVCETPTLIEQRIGALARAVQSAL